MKKLSFSALMISAISLAPSVLHATAPVATQVSVNTYTGYVSQAVALTSDSNLVTGYVSFSGYYNGTYTFAFEISPDGSHWCQAQETATVVNPTANGVSWSTNCRTKYVRIRCVNGPSTCSNNAWIVQ